MRLLQPIWLVLLIPLAVMLATWRFPTRLLTGLRGATLALLLLALCHPVLKLPDRAGSVVIVADRSDSMPAGSTATQREMINLVQKAMGSRDQLAVVSFGRRAAVEQPPRAGEFGGFTAQVGGDHSNLNEGLETALTLLPADSPGCILLLSDGKWTGSDPAAAAARASSRGVAIDHRLIARPPANDLAIERWLAPESVLPGQSYLLTAWVQSPTDQEIRYQLTRGPVIIAAGTRKVSPGLSRLLFRDRAPGPGPAQYELNITGGGHDPFPENNTARALVGVRGPKPILHVAEAGAKSGLAQLLARGGVDLTAKSPEECRWSLEELSRYSAVLLENIPAAQMGQAALETLASWVEETGSGLMMTGGRKSFGPGGYFKSPLDRVLPVSMELRQEHRKLRMAIVVVLDRSGSMAAPAGGGRQKMDLANLGTAQVLDLLGPMDEFGVIAVDTAPHPIVNLDTAENNRPLRNKILSIQSTGGGIYIFEALKAASVMLARAKAETKHLILFADAADSEEPGNYKELLRHAREAGITVSVVGLGTPKDVDASLLEDIAKRGEGQIYFTDNADDLPRIFAQDTFTVARSTFIDETTRVKPTAAFTLLGAPNDWRPPAIGGYNLTYLRPEASLALVTEDEYAAPAVAAWQAGSGRVLCYTGEADGPFAGAMAQWPQVGDFHATLARWSAGKQSPLPDNLLLTQEVRDGACILQLHLDPDRRVESFAGQPHAKVLHGLPGQPPAKVTMPLQWRSADLLEAVLPIHGRETLLATVEIPGLPPATLTPVCLPYSPEFAPEQSGRGRTALEKISTATGGEQRVDLAAIWGTLPKRPRFIELAPGLILLAATLFLMEILQRRTGALQLLPRLRLRRERGAVKTETAPGRETVPPAKAAAQKKAAQEGTPPAAPVEELGSFEALRQARQRARNRHGNHDREP
jgi:Mg-chelatase subunit ChlD/uncharacterized membrane protein